MRIMNRFKFQNGFFLSTMTTLQFDFFSILQCDFFVLNKDTEECHIGERMRATSTLSESKLLIRHQRSFKIKH